MLAIFRAVGSVVAGLAVAFLLVIAVEFFSFIVHPLPPDFGGTHEEMCKHVERYPDWVLAVCVAFYVGTAFVSTWITGRIGNRGCAIFLGLILMGGLITNIA